MNSGCSVCGNLNFPSDQKRWSANLVSQLGQQPEMAFFSTLPEPWLYCILGHRFQWKTATGSIPVDGALRVGFRFVFDQQQVLVDFGI